MALYTLVDGVQEKVWPDLPVTLIGQGLTVDNTLATSRITAAIPISLLVTMSVGFLNIPLGGGSVANLIAEIRAFTTGDVQKSGRALSSLSIDRDTPDSGLNVAFIEVLLAGEYFDLTCLSVGQTLTDIEILTALQFWILGR